MQQEKSTGCYQCHRQSRIKKSDKSTGQQMKGANGNLHQHHNSHQRPTLCIEKGKRVIIIILKSNAGGMLHKQPAENEKKEDAEDKHSTHSLQRPT